MIGVIHTCCVKYVYASTYCCALQLQQSYTYSTNGSLNFSNHYYNYQRNYCRYLHFSKSE